MPQGVSVRIVILLATLIMSLSAPAGAAGGFSVNIPPGWRYSETPDISSWFLRVYFALEPRVKNGKLTNNMHRREPMFMLSVDGTSLKQRLERVFEATGEISLHRLILIGVALGAIDDFNDLFHEPQYSSLDDVINAARPRRQRGGRND